MVTLHPEPLSRDGKRFILIPAEEFEAWQEEIEEIHDIIALSEAEAEAGKEPRIPWEVLKKELGLL
jgi:PHD/YefM family antitoxin component YafN of YafNO toxin-antitoxin module